MLKTLKTIDGIEHIFNTERFKQYYNGIDGQKRPHGSKGKIRDDLAQKTSYAESTVRGWIRGSNGPSFVDTVHVIEDYFDIPRNGLLMPRTQKDAEKGKAMRDIPEYERDAARRLYHELCDMTDGLHYSDPVLAMRLGLPTTKEGFRHLGGTPYPFLYRERLLLLIRREGFDLPSSIRDELISLVLEAFGEDCGEDGLLYLRSQGYADYLANNELNDNEDAREMYSIVFVRRLEERIDDLFSVYMF